MPESKDATLVKRPFSIIPGRCALRAVRPWRADRAARVTRIAIGLVAFWVSLVACPASAQVEFPEASTADPVIVLADSANHWTLGGYEVWMLQGNCRIDQGGSSARAKEGVIWVDRASPMDHGRGKVIAYLEGDVTVDQVQDGSRARVTDNAWVGRFFSAAGIEVHISRVTNAEASGSPLYQRAQAQRDREFKHAVQQAQATKPLISADGQPLPAGSRRIRVFPRSDVPVQAQWFPDRQTNQWIAVIDSGVNLIVDGLPKMGSIDVSTDRLIIWTRGMEEPDLTGNKPQAENTPLELYMEGNIVFRQGERIIHAEKMYYDVPNQVGTVLRAELMTPVPKYEGRLRLRAEILRQTGKDHFEAENAYLTSSRIGAPSYRLQTGNLSFDDRQEAVIDPATGQPVVDPRTGEPVVEHERLAKSSNNFLFLEDVPVFYWPATTTDLEDSSFFLRRFRFKQDNVFGTQIMTNWNLFHLLGMRRPKGTEWDFSLDYLSKRGLGHGMDFTYANDTFFDFGGPTRAMLDYWGIYDHGTDNLGSDRRDIQPEKDYRFRLFGQYRQMFSDNLQLTAEAGWISDRNFLEEYYKSEWDDLKDMTTGLELKQLRENSSWSITADYRVNNFFTQTNWLPRLDHFWMGESLINDSFTWYEHSNAAYAQLRTASAPGVSAINDPVPFKLLPWEVNVKGERLATRQEIDYPFEAGPVKVVPYALGELAHWGEDINGESLDRAYGLVGVRASIPFWRVDRDVESVLWNVHGLAHKISLEVNGYAADANRHIDQLPLYDPLDDDNIEAFRRRFAYTTYTTGNIPKWFDERYYALRTGLGTWVASPSTEIADRLSVVNMGVHQRWQTKRGVEGQQRIIDWITFDVDFSLYPDSSRDNYDLPIGLLDYNARWQVGDRLALLSSGTFDFFDEGQKIVSVGAFLDRPPRGSIYLGARMLEGPIHSTVLLGSFSYRMSPKWIAGYGASIDLVNNNAIGQSLNITRIGEAFLVSAGFNVDVTRGTWGMNFAIEPRILPKGRLGTAGGARVPSAGANGLE